MYTCSGQCDPSRECPFVKNPHDQYVYTCLRCGTVRRVDRSGEPSDGWTAVGSILTAILVLIFLL